MLHMTENDLADQGYAVVGDQALRIESDHLTVAKIPELTDDQLYTIGLNRLVISEQAQEQALDLGKKAAAQRWWVGKVFGEIKKRKNRQWFLFLNTKNLGSKRTTIDDAISLSERMTLDRASELGLTDAMREAGVWEERKVKEAKAGEAPPPVEQENEADDGEASAPVQAKKSRTPNRKKKGTGDGDGKADDGGENGQPDAPNAGAFVQADTPNAGANGKADAPNGQPSSGKGADKISECPFEFNEEEDLITWIQRLDKANNDAPKFPLTVMLPLTANQKQALQQQLEDDLDTFQPDTLDNL